MHPGDLSNIEVDVLARYVARCLGIAKDDPKQVSTDASFLVALSSSGYL
jgi:riboflavin synthase alpha subunit